MPKKPDIKATALALIDLMCNKRDFANGATYLSPNMEQYQDDKPPLQGSEAFLANFKTMLTELAPESHVDVLDAVCEGNKVWVYVRISGLPGGMVKEGVDMTVWSEEGTLISLRNFQRVLETGKAA